MLCTDIPVMEYEPDGHGQRISGSALLPYED